MPRFLRAAPGVALLLALLAGLGVPAAQQKPPALEVGFAQADITPKVGGDRPVYLAGFGKNRKATGVHDPLMARAVVLRSGTEKVALVSVDLVGFFLDNVEAVRKKLPGFTYVLVSSTHNHEGPDTLGLWGPTLFQSGVDRDYIAAVEAKIVQAVKDADAACKPAEAKYGTATAPELLHDGRKPEVLHDELVALSFHEPGKEQPAGLVVQWNCHPETLGSSNTLVSADYVGYTVAALSKKHGCPVVYLTGTVGGLLTSLHVPIKDAEGKELKDGTYEKTERYGLLLAAAADKAVAAGKPIALTPFVVRAEGLYLPVTNPLYRLGWQLKIFDRDTYVPGPGGKGWAKSPPGQVPAEAHIRTEVGYLKLGELEVAAIPGEIYPELVLGKVLDPAPAGADFPDAAVEPAVYAQLKGGKRLLIGLANDEIGYIIPQRQWDEKPPVAFGLKKPQYGEENSLGPKTAPLLCEAFRALLAR